MMAISSLASLTAERDRMVALSHERLEEFAFHVAQDLEWLRNYPQTHFLAGEQESPQIGNEGSNKIAVDVLKEDTIGRIVEVDWPPVEHDEGQNVNQLFELNATQRIQTEDLSSDSNFPQQTSVVIQDASLAQSQEAQETFSTPIENALHEQIDTPQSLRKILDDREEIPIQDTAKNALPQQTGRILMTEILTEPQSKRAFSDLEASVVDSCAVVPEAEIILNKVLEEQVSGNTIDYMEPINLESPPKRDASRADSAYFSAAESPSTGTHSIVSPRQSITFASLPPRQPFAKKSLGHRSSQNRSSTHDPIKHVINFKSSTLAIKQEPPPTPQISTAQVHGMEQLSPKIKIEPGNIRLDLPQVDRVPNQISLDKGAIRIQEQLKTMQAKTELNLSHQVLKEPANPFVVADSGLGQVVEEVLVRKGDVHIDEDDWLPRFEGTTNSPRKLGLDRVSKEGELVIGKLPVSSSTIPVAKSPTRRQLNLEGHETPGPLRAAMQAASAKATSYLRQARTAFGSPATNHTKVFSSHTPKHSPPKRVVKLEAQTPKLYPELGSVQSQNAAKPSLIPSKTPRGSPLKQGTTTEELMSPRRSARRSPRKGTLANESMAVMAARSAASKPMGESHVDDGAEKITLDKENLSSPRKVPKVLSRLTTQNKTKPLAIRVATASQREFDNSKDRKLQIPSMTSQERPSVLSKSTSDNPQLDYLNKQPGGPKRMAASRQIKALAAATQAKEKAEKEQERREQQRKEIEKKRQENARRQADDEEKRRVEQNREQSRKRQMTLDARTNSAKKQVRSVTSKGQLHEAIPTDSVQTSTKRQLADITEGNHTAAADGVETKRRCTNDSVEPMISQAPGAVVISKPVRISLQKKSLFGHPGEPGYKRPGTNTFTVKTGTLVDSVKFSNEPVKFSNNASLPIASAQSSNLHEQSKAVNLPPSELIELPEIHSDYSDSDDDDAPQKDAFERPTWAETPELRKLLRRQQKIDPDDVFGPIPPLQMEEIFKGKERALARFRPRSSSANWSGNDKLSAEEVSEYAKIMGYKA